MQPKYQYLLYQGWNITPIVLLKAKMCANLALKIMLEIRKLYVSCIKGRKRKLNAMDSTLTKVGRTNYENKYI